MNGRAVDPGGRESGAGSTPASQIAARIAEEPVSYTHLTLPTIYSV